MVNISPRFSSKGLDEALTHLSIPLLPCQVTVSSLIGLSDAKKLKIKSRTNGSKKKNQKIADDGSPSGLGRTLPACLVLPSISTSTNRPSKLIYTEMSAVITGFIFSSSQHECRVNINNISRISRESLHVA